MPKFHLVGVGDVAGFERVAAHLGEVSEHGPADHAGEGAHHEAERTAQQHHPAVYGRQACECTSCTYSAVGSFSSSLKIVSFRFADRNYRFLVFRNISSAMRIISHLVENLGKEFYETKASGTNGHTKGILSHMNERHFF